MKSFLYSFFIISLSLFSQENIEATLIKTTPLKVEQLVAIDNFGTLLYINNTVLYKKTPEKTVNYSNVQLGNITSASAFNPLKINLFYKHFNTAILLDNRLSELLKIDFNTLQPYKSVSHLATGYDNLLWIFNQDLQQLELFDYKTNKTRTATLPVQSRVLDLDSNYNTVWLLTENWLYEYNYFGSLISKLKNDHFMSISEDNGNLIIQKKDGLYFLAKNTKVLKPIKLPELLIKQFLLTNETLYIYTDEILHQFQLKIR